MSTDPNGAMPSSADSRSPGLSRWERLSTGVKMWIILSVGLLPLGIVAIMASVESARANRDKYRVEAQALLTEHVQRFTVALTRNAIFLRTARDALLTGGDAEMICARALGRLNGAPNTPGKFALYGNDPIPRCLSPGFLPPDAPEPQGQPGRASISPDGETLNIFLYAPDGAIEGIAQYRAEALMRAVAIPPVDGDFAVELAAGDRILSLRRRNGRGRESLAERSFANGDYAMRVRNSAPAVSFSEIVAILAPVLMWLWASVIGWILVQRLLLQPLVRIQKVIAAYQPGDRGLDLPDVRTPAKEIGALGQAFARVTRTVAGHEEDLEAAVERQKRLVREVHHRVKNNLQVVASLLNLHARGADSPEVAAAYASIQRRVDALAVVHRNHHAAFEESRGVALKPLVSELAANLRATAPPNAAGMQIGLDIAPLHVNQDVAVSVAFLVTEIVEFGMLCGARMVAVAVEPDGPGAATLSIEVDSLAGSVECDGAVADRFGRIVAGLARQLRSTLEHAPDSGRYAVRIAVLDS